MTELQAMACTGNPLHHIFIMQSMAWVSNLSFNLQVAIQHLRNSSTKHHRKIANVVEFRVFISLLAFFHFCTYFLCSFGYYIMIPNHLCFNTPDIPWQHIEITNPS